MQGHADSESGLATAPSSPTRYLCSGRDGECDEDGGGIHYFFSAPASPVHYILRSPPASSASVHYAPSTDGDFCTAPGDFEFAARHRGIDGAGATTTMSSAEELFLSGRIRVGGLSPIRQETDCREQQGEDGEDEGGVEGRSPRPRRTRSASPPRSPRLAKTAEPADSLASASSSSSSSSSSSAKTMRRRISLRDLLGRTCSDPSMRPPAPITTAAERSGSWLPSIWPARAKKALPSPAPQPARRSVSSVRAAPGGAGRDEAPRRRTTSLPYRQGLVLGCLGLGARSYGLAKSMHPLSTR
ncbi:trinucleotide repeat-containing gene 18 protein-like [Triticum urartu]|nr:trinucleotide repeat-containing gene 18 protein-like [Triticum urartu]XP_048567876.1 trinucleotide repeat-containing gene 18 protein-like [Triticum urartu]